MYAGEGQVMHNGLEINGQIDPPWLDFKWMGQKRKAYSPS